MVLIDNVHDLLTDMQEYEQMFPQTHTKYEDIKETIEKNEEAPPGSVFGISVASDWKDKCYGFEVDLIKLDITIVRYVGIWKC